MERHTDRFEVSERDELHNVPEDRLALRWPQDAIVSIQDLHICEICIAHSDNDDGERLVGRSDNGFTCVRHVCDHAICEDEQDVVSLQEIIEENYLMSKLALLILPPFVLEQGHFLACEGGLSSFLEGLCRIDTTTAKCGPELESTLLLIST